MDDRFTRGLIAGLMAWVPTLTINYLFKSLGIAKIMFKDFMAIMVYGKLPTTTWEHFFAYIAQIGLFAVLGVIFAFLILKIGTKNYLLKGVVYSLSLWFIFYAVTVLYKVPSLTIIPLGTALGNFVGSLVYGFSMSIILGWLDRKANNL